MTNVRRPERAMAHAVADAALAVTTTSESMHFARYWQVQFVPATTHARFGGHTP